jgi:hypothetical protein
MANKHPDCGDPGCCDDNPAIEQAIKRLRESMQNGLHEYGASYVELDDLRTLLAERDRLRESNDKLTAYIKFLQDERAALTRLD